MRIEVRDPYGQSYMIDALDPELLAKWLLEVFTRMGPVEHRVGPALVQVFPSVTPDGKVDFIADTRVLGRMYQVNTPREVLGKMGEMITDLEKMTT